MIRLILIIALKMENSKIKYEKNETEMKIKSKVKSIVPFKIHFISVSNLDSQLKMEK